MTDKNKLPPPKKGDKPKRIVADGSPGGPHTPGAKEARRQKSKDDTEWRRKQEK